MRRLIHAATVALWATPVAGAPIGVWSGPGPNACDGRCSVEWAVSQLTDEQREALALVQETQPDPKPLFVYDGDYFPAMAYFKDGAPHMDKRGTVASVPDPEPAVGWRVGEWSFLRIDACQNWAVVVPASNVGPTGASPAVYRTPAGGFLPPVWTTTYTPTPSAPAWPPVWPPVDPGPPVGPGPDPDPPVIAPVSLASAATNLLAGLIFGAALVWLVGRLERAAPGAGWSGHDKSSS